MSDDTDPLARIAEERRVRDRLIADATVSAANPRALPTLPTRAWANRRQAAQQQARAQLTAANAIKRTPGDG